MVHAEDFRDAVVEIWVLWRQKNIFQLLNIRVVQLANHRDPSRREATRAQLTWPITEILLEERLLRTVGLISPDDQLCCTQASQGDCVAGEGYHPADVPSFCLLRLSSILVCRVSSAPCGIYLQCSSDVLLYIWRGRQNLPSACCCWFHVRKFRWGGQPEFTFWLLACCWFYVRKFGRGWFVPSPRFSTLPPGKAKGCSLRKTQCRKHNKSPINAERKGVG